MLLLRARFSLGARRAHAPLWLLCMMGSVIGGPRVAGAQVPRIAPPPPCRVPAGFRDRLTDVQLPATRGPSIVVLPFIQTVIERRSTHVSQVLGERIIRRLSATPGVSVASAGVVARVTFETRGNTDSTIRLIGAKLALSGSLDPAGLDTRVSVRLASADDGKAVWQANYLLSRSSVQDIERNVVDEIRKVLKLARPTSEPAPVRREVDDYVAVAEYLMSEHSFAAADSARQLLELAFRTDTSSRIAIALARSGVAAFERGTVQDANATAAARRRADALVAYALNRDSGNADAWTLRAMAARIGDPEQLAGAEEAHRRAIRLDPRSADAEDEYARTLLVLGRSAEAAAHLRRALALDPGRASTMITLATISVEQGNAALACALTNAAIGADPFNPRGYTTRATARLRLAQTREAFSDAETAIVLMDSPFTRAIRLLVEVSASNLDLARGMGRDYASRYLSRAGTLRVDDALGLAKAFVALGSTRDAMGALSRARPIGRELATGLADPAFQPLRRDPGFVALLRSIPARR